MGGGNGRKHRWIISFGRSSSSSSSASASAAAVSKDPPREFLCPVTGSLMADPVVVSSGQTFERVSAQVCKDLGFSPAVDDGSRPDFTALISNKALQRTILNWCDKSGSLPPQAPDYSSVERVVRSQIAALDGGEEEEEPRGEIRASERELLKGVAENPPVIFSHAVSEVGPRVNHFYSSPSEESVVVAASPETPLPLTTRPSCFSPCSSSELVESETLGLAPNPEEENLLAMLESSELYDQEQGVLLLRKITRTKEESRISLCTPRMIAALKPLLAARHNTMQVNAVASLVNLSLENANKVKIVRSGIVPLLIDVLTGSFGEAQEHAAGALFSLALDDDNKMAIGVLGALPPLLHALRSESERMRHDSALALYNLTLVQSNRIKLVKLNAVPALLAMVKAKNLANRVLLILCNLAACVEGKSAMLDANAVGILVELLRGKEVESEASRETCVAALYAMSNGSLRFKGLVRDAKAVEVLREVEEKGTDRAREKARRLIEMMRGTEQGEEEDPDRLVPLESSGFNRTRYRFGHFGPDGRNLYGANTTEF
ncbi:U-box domain-containing protein 38-like [Syzygium oleosum]|uniref:U-box domain-containing protein 38-like n=1 Tax=Syzygium oleosum TaxID=219896 RepID=UPI0024BB6976|nr:U-box domain-containing protein 38-like [Syzygium oleosum]